MPLFMSRADVGPGRRRAMTADRRGVHTRVLEARGLAIRCAHAVAHLVEGHLHGREKAFVDDAGSAPPNRTSLDQADIEDNAAHSGVNIFCRGFGNHNHDILMRLHLK